MHIYKIVEHRHLNHQEFTLAAIDDIISRGNLADWLALRNSMKENPGLAERINKIAHTRTDPAEQRYRFWQVYVRRKSA